MEASSPPRLVGLDVSVSQIPQDFPLQDAYSQKSNRSRLQGSARLNPTGIEHLGDNR